MIAAEPALPLAKRALADAALLETDRAAAARRRLLRLQPRLEATLRSTRIADARFGIAVGLDACFEHGAQRERHLDLLDETARELTCPRSAAYLRFRAARAEFLRGHWESALARLRALGDTLPADDDLAGDARLVESAALRYVGSASQALTITESMLQGSSVSPTIRMRAHFHHAGALLMLGRVEQVEAAARDALALTLSLSAARQRALVFALLSLHAIAAERPSLASEYAAESARRFTALGDRMMLGKALGFLARSELEHGSPTARRTLLRAQKAAAATGDRGIITELALLHAEHVRESGRVRLQECLWDNETLGLTTLAERARAALEQLPAADSPRLVIGPLRVRIVDGSTSLSIDLSRHEKPRRLLRRLAEARAADQGPLPVDALLVAAWPGERLVGSSGQNRVYAAIRFLRREGLATVLRSCSAGYELTCPVRFES